MLKARLIWHFLCKRSNFSIFCTLYVNYSYINAFPHILMEPTEALFVWRGKVRLSSKVKWLYWETSSLYFCWKALRSIYWVLVDWNSWQVFLAAALELWRLMGGILLPFLCLGAFFWLWFVCFPLKSFFFDIREAHSRWVDCCPSLP